MQTAINIKTLLFFAATNNHQVYHNPNGGYSLAPHNMDKDADLTAYTIESRLQFELFGEYPLSPNAQKEWDTICDTTLNMSQHSPNTAATMMDIQNISEVVTGASTGVPFTVPSLQKKIKSIVITESFSEFSYCITKANGCDVYRYKSRGTVWHFKTLNGCKRNLIDFLITDWK